MLKSNLECPVPLKLAYKSHFVDLNLNHLASSLRTKNTFKERRKEDCRRCHQTLPNLGLILGLRTSLVPYRKTLGRFEVIGRVTCPITRDRMNPCIS